MKLVEVSNDKTQKDKLYQKLEALEFENNINLKTWPRLYSKGLFEVPFFAIKRAPNFKLFLAVWYRKFSSEYFQTDPLFSARINRQQKLLDKARELVDQINAM